MGLQPNSEEKMQIFCVNFYAHSPIQYLTLCFFSNEHAVFCLLFGHNISVIQQNKRLQPLEEGF